METYWEKNLLCPVCGEKTERIGGSLFCRGARRHCFDFSAAGYLNFAPATATGSGDDATLVAARTAFLDAGYYRPFAENLTELLRQYAPSGACIDAGCGEGYYTSFFARSGYKMLGVDLSKKAIAHAAKRAKKEELDALFAVCGVFSLPVGEACADAVVSLFAPIAEEEFCRVLKKGGVLITVAAGKDHLSELKSLLYDTPRGNAPRADLPKNTKCLASNRIAFSMRLDNKALCDLFAMTPYYYRTPREGRERLQNTDSLSVLAEAEISVFRKK